MEENPDSRPRDAGKKRVKRERGATGCFFSGAAIWFPGISFTSDPRGRCVESRGTYGKILLVNGGDSSTGKRAAE
jgi:hypothetical protein